MKPSIVQLMEPILGIKGVNLKDTVGALNGRGEFSLIRFGDAGNASISVVKPGWPDHFSLDVHSDDENNIMWTVRGRGVYFIDLESKDTAHVIASNDGNGRIISVFTADPRRRIMGITYNNCPGCANILLLFDLRSGSKINEITIGPAQAYPYYDGKILNLYHNKDRTRKWFVCGYFAEGPEDLLSDDLTRKLTETQMDAGRASEVIHLKKRMMVCHRYGANNRVSYFIVRWDEGRKNVTVEPLPKPGRKNFDERFVFSPTGEWIRAVLAPRYGQGTRPDLTLFHTGHQYPSGISPPLIGGYAAADGWDAFLDHREWGPCYLDWDLSFPQVLFVYRLNECLETAVRQAEGGGALTLAGNKIGKFASIKMVDRWFNVVLELDDGSRVEALWDRSLSEPDGATSLSGGMMVEIAPIKDAPFWKVVRIVDLGEGSE